MARLFVLVEGETEETFINEVLAPHLYETGFESVSARLMGNARLRAHRGGVRPWPSVQADIVRHLKGDRKVFVTMMVDYYGMPSGAKDPRAWPGRQQAARLPFAKKPPASNPPSSSTSRKTWASLGPASVHSFCGDARV